MNVVGLQSSAFGAEDLERVECYFYSAMKLSSALFVHVMLDLFLSFSSAVMTLAAFVLLFHV